MRGYTLLQFVTYFQQFKLQTELYRYITTIRSFFKFSFLISSRGLLQPYAFLYKRLIFSEGVHKTHRIISLPGSKKHIGRKQVQWRHFSLIMYDIMKIRNSGPIDLKIGICTNLAVGNSNLVISRHKIYIVKVYWCIFSLIMHEKMKIRVAGSRYMKICIVIDFVMGKLKRIIPTHEIIIFGTNLNNVINY